MKRRRKQFTKTTASRNALSSQEPKRRFGKKQKKKLAIIGAVVLIVCIGLSFLVRDLQAKRALAEEKAKKGRLIERDAEKTKYDQEGKEVITHKNTEIIIFDVGDGGSVLIKKGNYDVLVDAGGNDITEKLKEHITGHLEYFITTNSFDDNMKNADAVMKNFNVDNYIYNNIGSTVGEKASGQVIDMGENLSVIVTPGIDGNAHDRTAIVTVTDNDRKIFIVGNATAKDITTLKTENQNCLAYITSGKPNTNNTPLSVLLTINPQYIIASTATKLSADFIDNNNKLNAQLFATYKSKDIIFTIDANEARINLAYDDQIRSSDKENAENGDEETAEEDGLEEGEEDIIVEDEEGL